MGFLKYRRTTRSHITSYLTWDIRPIGRFGISPAYTEIRRTFALQWLFEQIYRIRQTETLKGDYSWE